MSEPINLDVDSRPQLQRTTDISQKCVNNVAFLKFELRELEAILALIGSPTGERKTQFLTELIEEKGEDIRKEYCLNHCDYSYTCITGRGYQSQRARSICLPSPYKREKI